MTRNQLEKIVRDAYENFPEASAGSALQCVGWNYREFKFLFVDEETGEKHGVTLPMAIKGLRLFIRAVNAGELPGLGLPAHYLSDLGTWDSIAFDALAQMAVFGEVIYG